MNKLTIDGYTAMIAYDEDIDMFRGEFVGLNGGADFYANDIESLHKEAKISLQTFLAVCAEQGISPVKSYSGILNTQIEPALHERLATIAMREGISINEFVKRAIRSEILATA